MARKYSRHGRKRRFSRRFGAFTGGSPHSLLQMQGPYGASSYGRRRKRRFSRKFGAFTGGSPHSLLQMQGPYGASSYGRRRKRKSYGSRRFGAFTGGSPHSLLQMQGPYGASSYGRRRRRKSYGRRKFSRCKSSFGRKMKMCDCGKKYRKKRAHQKVCKLKSKSKRGKRGKRKSYGRRKRRYSGMHHRGYGKVMGQGYKAQTTYPNVSAPYFGAAEPWTNASGWWYPVTGGKVQSPGMTMKNPK